MSRHLIRRCEDVHPNACSAIVAIAVELRTLVNMKTSANGSAVHNTVNMCRIEGYHKLKVSTKQSSEATLSTSEDVV